MGQRLCGCFSVQCGVLWFRDRGKLLRFRFMRWCVHMRRRVQLWALFDDDRGHRVRDGHILRWWHGAAGSVHRLTGLILRHE